MTQRQEDDHFSVSPESITTVIDKGVHVEGKITVETGKSVLIRGEFTGSIESNGVVIVSQGATCTGSVVANKIRVAGAIRKTAGGERCAVVAKDGLLVERTGSLDTDELSYGGIELQFGARISGAMTPMTGVQAASAEPAVVEPVAASPSAPSPAVVVQMPGVPNSLLAARLNASEDGDEFSDSASAHAPQRANGGF